MIFALCSVHSSLKHNVIQPCLWPLQHVCTRYTLHFLPRGLIQPDQIEGTLRSGENVSLWAVWFLLLSDHF